MAQERIFLTYSNATAVPKSEQMTGQKIILGHHKALIYDGRSHSNAARLGNVTLQIIRD